MVCDIRSVLLCSFAHCLVFLKLPHNFLRLFYSVFEVLLLLDQLHVASQVGQQLRNDGVVHKFDEVWLVTRRVYQRQLCGTLNLLLVSLGDFLLLCKDALADFHNDIVASEGFNFRVNCSKPFLQVEVRLGCQHVLARFVVDFEDKRVFLRDVVSPLLQLKVVLRILVFIWLEEGKPRRRNFLRKHVDRGLVKQNQVVTVFVYKVSLQSYRFCWGSNKR